MLIHGILVISSIFALCLPTASALPYPYRILVTAPQSFTTFLVIEEVSVSYHIHSTIQILIHYYSIDRGPSYARSLRSIVSSFPSSAVFSDRLFKLPSI